LQPRNSQRSRTSAAAVTNISAAGVIAVALAGAAVRLLYRRIRQVLPEQEAQQAECPKEAQQAEACDDATHEVGRRKRPKLPELTAAELGQLEAEGKVRRQERDGPVGWGFVAADVSAPAKTVMGCLEAFEDYSNMIPVVRHTTVHFRKFGSGGSVSAACTYSISRWWLGISVVHKVIPAAGLVRFDLDPTRSGVALQECSGFWFVEPSPTEPGSRCRIWLYVRGLRTHALLPRWLVDYAAERGLSRATDWLRPHAERCWQKERQKQLG